MSIVDKAEILARKAHAGQKRKGGDDFMTHVNGVVTNTFIFIDANHPKCDEIVCAALLHDVVEDTSVTLNDLLNYFNLEIKDAVDLVTRRKEETYKEFINRIYDSYNEIAIVVKLADLSHNIYSSILFDGDESVKKELDSLREKRWVPAYDMLYKRWMELYGGKVENV